MKPSFRSVSPKWASVFVPLVLLLLGGVYTFEYLGLYSRWWFEDDPSLFAYAREVGNPAGIFLNPEILRHFTTGKALVPMQLLSYWIDVRVAGFSPTFAYVHQECSFLLTLLVLYFLLLQLLRNDKTAAFSIALLWVLLPSTSVVVQFLATRHYLEGLLFSGLAILFLNTTLGGKNHRLRWLVLFAVLSCSSIALLYKETYAAILPAIMLAYAWNYKDRRLGLSAAMLICGYATYRFWMLGPALSYNIPLLGVSQYLKFVSKLPYTISSNYGGYGLFGLLVVLCVYSARQKPPNHKIIVGFLALIVLSLAAILPVSYPLYLTIRVPGTWYRIIFVLNSILLVFGGCWAARYLTRRMQVLAALLAVVFLGAGSVKTQKLWATMTESAEREGKFYLNNPDKVLLSEQAAWWFIPGVHWMYGVKNPHYVLLKDLRATKIESPIWRFRGGRFVPDDPPLEHAAGNP